MLISYRAYIFTNFSSTTFRDNFVAWPVCPPKQRVPSAHIPPEGPLESKTCYRDDFGAKTARPVCFTFLTDLFLVK